jgi:hypothetical protein
MTDIEPRDKESVMAEQWVSFQNIKDQVSIKDVVDHYGLHLSGVSHYPGLYLPGDAVYFVIQDSCCGRRESADRNHLIKSA